MFSVAGIGIYLTLFSSAAINAPPYQYSVSTCTSSTSTAVVTCRDQSAEALTFRYYRALKNTNPDSGGYKYWSQLFAGDRIQPTDVGNRMVGSINTLPADNTAFVKMVYKNLNGSDIDSGGATYFTQQLTAKTWSRGQVVAHMATQNGAMVKQAPAWVDYLRVVGTSFAPITQNAAIAQQKRTDKTLVYATIAKNQYGKSPDLVTLGRKQRDEAKTIASKSSIGKSDLTAIAYKEKTVKDYMIIITEPTKQITNAMNENKKLTAEAAAVTAYSPDISKAAIVSNNDKTIYYAASINGIYSDLKNLVGQISAQYKVAEGKYEAGLKTPSTHNGGSGNTGADGESPPDNDSDEKPPTTKLPITDDRPTIGAQSVGCRWGYYTQKQQYQNTNKYRCRMTLGLLLPLPERYRYARPYNLICSDPAHYEAKNEGNTWKYCGRK